MFVLGLTGSIGMGKSAAATIFRRHNIPVYDADFVVHELLGKNGTAVEPVADLFEGVVSCGQVDRKALGKQVFEDANALYNLEAILHPLVRGRQLKFLKSAANHRQPIVVLDIPLLFETGGEVNCHAVAVVSAPHYLQKIRVMARRGMTEEKFQGILARQMHDREKRRRANFVIPTGLGKRRSLQSIKSIIKVVKKAPSPNFLCSSKAGLRLRGIDA